MGKPTSVVVGNSGHPDFKNAPSAISINLDRLMATRLFVAAQSGAGKSWLLRRIIEQSHGQVQQIIIDPEGEFYSLREKFDFVIARADGKRDCPADPRSAGLLATSLLSLGVSAVIDIYDLKPPDQKEFVKQFCEALINAPRRNHRTMVVIDEAQRFAPEKGMGDAASTDAVVDLCARGRKRGIAAILASQRISKISKNALAELGNYLLGRVTLDVDVKRVIDTLGFNDKDATARLRRLADGEFFFYGSAFRSYLPGPSLVLTGDIQTTHPKAGKKPPPVAPPQRKLMAVLKQLEALPEEQKQIEATAAEQLAEIKRLSAVTVTLTRQVKQLEGDLATEHDLVEDAHEMLEKAKQGVELKKGERIYTKKELDAATVAVVQAFLKKNVIRRLDSLHAGAMKQMQGAQEGMARYMVAASKDLRKLVKEASDVSIDDGPTRTPPAPVGLAPAKIGKRDLHVEGQRVSKQLSRPATPAEKRGDWRVIAKEELERIRATPASSDPGEDTGKLPVDKLTPYRRKILQALCHYPSGRSLLQLAILSGYRMSGGFNGAIASLKREHLIEGSGKNYTISATGKVAIGRVPPLPTGRELFAYWLANSDPYEAAILQFLRQSYPNPQTLEEVAQATNYKLSGGFNGAIAKLRRLELIEGSGKALKISADMILDD